MKMYRMIMHMAKSVSMGQGNFAIILRQVFSVI